MEIIVVVNHFRIEHLHKHTNKLFCTSFITQQHENYSQKKIIHVMEQQQQQQQNIQFELVVDILFGDNFFFTVNHMNSRI